MGVRRRALIGGKEDGIPKNVNLFDPSDIGNVSKGYWIRTAQRGENYGY